MSAPAGLVLALDIGGTRIKGTLVDAGGRLVDGHTLPTPVAGGPDAVVSAVRELARGLARSDVVAVAAVAPGVIDADAGIARYAANLGWRDVPIRQVLADELGVPVVLGHDVQAAGCAERLVGAARDVDDCLIVVIGTGIAAVVVSAGRTLTGATGAGGEIGHAAAWPDGEPCACGQRGCLETYASAAAITRRYRALGGSPDLSSAAIAARVADDPIAAQVWQEATDALAIALASATMLLDPALIVLGGGLAEAGQTLLGPVRAGLAERVRWRPVPAVRISPLASRAGGLGAAILGWQRVGVHDFSTWPGQLDTPQTDRP